MSLALIVTNCKPAEAKRLARSLVEERVAACVNVLPRMDSFYIWQDQLVEDVESTLLIKTTHDVLGIAIARLRELHSYDTPEILVIDPAQVDPAYLAWATEQVEGAK